MVDGYTVPSSVSAKVEKGLSAAADYVDEQISSFSWSDVQHAVPVWGNAAFASDALSRGNSNFSEGYYGQAALSYAEMITWEAMGVGQPGFGEGLIPIWGSGRAAVDDFQNGRWGWGLFNSALAVSDVFLVKSIGTALGKGAWKFGSHSWSATRSWLGKSGYAEAGQPVHHWAISQATAKEYGIEAITNQPWNLKTFADQGIHMRAGHGFNFLDKPGYGIVGRLWYGTPVWPKAVVGSYGGRLISR